VYFNLFKQKCTLPLPALPCLKLVGVFTPIFTHVGKTKRDQDSFQSITEYNARKLGVTETNNTSERSDGQFSEKYTDAYFVYLRIYILYTYIHVFYLTFIPSSNLLTLSRQMFHVVGKPKDNQDSS
jgi:hypothetical protein